MQKVKILIVPFVLCLVLVHAQLKPDPIRIIVIGAHPDDPDSDAGGTAAVMAGLGHAVKFLAVTNGDAGHQSEGGGMLAKRRIAEAQEAGRRLGVMYDVLDNHDGELTPTLEVRLQVIRKIREWKADLVIAPRPNDYHPDHRYTGILVQDAAYMVGVPNVAPDTPPLRKNPVFLYSQDNFQRPNPFRPDVTIDITAVFEKKVDAMAAHESQVYEWLPWIGGYAAEVPVDKSERRKWLSNRYRAVPLTAAVRKSLELWYGKEQAEKIQFAEAFEICEYGTQPGADDLTRLFPMLKKKN